MAVPIFISYGHDDDLPSPGWVSRFGEMLDLRLRTYLDRARFEIWRDPQLPGNADIWKRIEDKLAHADILVLIVSARYVTSSACLREFKCYRDKWLAKGSIYVGDSTRVFKVVKVPVERSDFCQDAPEELRHALLDEVLGYTFYKKTPRGAPVELDYDLDKGTYMAELADLAFQMKKFINQIGGAPPVPKGVVYLAESASDLVTERDAIRHDLDERQYTVLPSRPVNWNTDDYRAHVSGDLARSQLSVHLFGVRPGLIPDSAGDRGKSALQFESSLAVAALKGRRLVWVPEYVEPGKIEQAAHRGLVERLLAGSYAREGVEVLRGSLETLKRDIVDGLANGASENRDAALAPRQIFLICQESDVDGATPISEFLASQGYVVTIPSFDADDATRMTIHRQRLSECDAALLYQGNAPESWFAQNFSDLLKASGYRGNRPFAAAAYLAPPVTPGKRLRSGRQPLVIKHFEQFDPGVLKPFLAMVPDR
jgi:hypothetical protein